MNPGCKKCLYKKSLPLSSASASMTASIGGGSTAFARNGPIGPSRSNLIDSARAWRGVRKISGVVCWSSLGNIGGGSYIYNIVQ